MTAINVIKQSDSVHMLTDGATCRDGSRYAASTCKAFPVPHLNAVIATSGSLMWSPLILSNLLLSVTTYDELKQWAPTLLHKAVVEASHVFSGEGTPEVLLVVAGISETTGPDAFSVTTCERIAEPWVALTHGDCSLWPSTPEIQAEFHEAYGDVTSGDDLDPARWGVRAIEMQRKHPEAIIGGFVQLTSVTREGITTRIVHRWDEPIVGVHADAA